MVQCAATIFCLRVIQINGKLWKFLKFTQEPPKSTVHSWRCGSNISTTSHLPWGCDDRAVMMSWETTGGSLCVTRIQSREIHLGRLPSFLFGCNGVPPLAHCFLAHSIRGHWVMKNANSPSLGGQVWMPFSAFPKTLFRLNIYFLLWNRIQHLIYIMGKSFHLRPSLFPLSQANTLTK